MFPASDLETVQSLRLRGHAENLSKDVEGKEYEKRKV